MTLLVTFSNTAVTGSVSCVGHHLKNSIIKYNGVVTPRTNNDVTEKIMAVSFPMSN
jgi:hypothetical protein